MPLCLTWKPGNDLFIGERPMTLVRADRADEFIVTFEGQEFEVDQHHWTKLAPGIEVRSTIPRTNTCRVQINAPAFVVHRGQPKPDYKH